MSINRYTIVTINGEWQVRGDPHGEWVRIENALSLEAEVERLVEQHSVLDGVINDYIDKLKAERAAVARLQARVRELEAALAAVHLCDCNPVARAALAAVSAEKRPTVSSYVDIVFDGPPGPESGRFVEVEDANGRGFRLGEWVERSDGLWALRIPNLTAREADVEMQMQAVRRALVRDNRDKTNTIRELQARVDELQEELHATDVARLRTDGPHG